MVGLPEPFASFNRFPLLFEQPSPLHVLTGITRQIQATTTTKARIWAKREDCSSGLGLGGNKIRKLEYVVPSAVAQGCDTLVSEGGIQSNHMRQVAAVGSHLGLRTILVPHTHSTSQSENFARGGNVQMNNILGAEYWDSDVTLEEVATDIKARGGQPYIISSGASAHMYGGLGFARWAFEVVEQEATMGVFFDTVVVAVASGGTLAGMIAGFKLADRLKEPTLNEKHTPRTVIGIDTYDKPPGVLEATILEIAQRTAELIGLEDGAVQARDVLLDTRHNHGTHSNWNENTEKAVKLLGKLEGIVSDPIYSGRALGAVLNMAERGELDEKANVLFVHTGGQAALGAFPSMR